MVSWMSLLRQPSGDTDHAIAAWFEVIADRLLNHWILQVLRAAPADHRDRVLLPRQWTPGLPSRTAIPSSVNVAGGISTAREMATAAAVSKAWT